MAWSEIRAVIAVGRPVVRPSPLPVWQEFVIAPRKDPEAVLAREPETCHPRHSSRRDVGATPGHRRLEQASILKLVLSIIDRQKRLWAELLRAEHEGRG